MLIKIKLNKKVTMLKKFSIICQKDIQSIDNQNESILLNMNHVVSVKMIKMIVNEDVAEGFWIRMSNGKKYRAIEVPNEIKELLA